jgi:hypothetical protein
LGFRVKPVFAGFRGWGLEGRATRLGQGKTGAATSARARAPPAPASAARARLPGAALCAHEADVGGLGRLVQRYVLADEHAVGKRGRWGLDGRGWVRGLDGVCGAGGCSWRGEPPGLPAGARSHPRMTETQHGTAAMHDRRARAATSSAAQQPTVCRCARGRSRRGTGGSRASLMGAGFRGAGLVGGGVLWGGGGGGGGGAGGLGAQQAKRPEA